MARRCKKVRTLAVRRADGTVAVVAMNESDEDLSVDLHQGDETYTLDLPACSIATAEM